MNWKLPNQLTVGRLALAVVFFVLLGLYDPLPDQDGALLLWGFALYIVAGITDVLDGYLARRWNLQTAFGRITDPFVDKVLVVGAFAMFAGGNFAFSQGVGEFERGLAHWVTGGMASGVQAWMVVAVMAREFIVSGVRGYSESQGQKFPATVWGKLKMFTQSCALCMILLQLAVGPQCTWMIVLKLVLVWLSVAVTIFSGLAYVGKARKLMTAGEDR